jgi:hypothetical protein
MSSGEFTVISGAEGDEYDASAVERSRRITSSDIRALDFAALQKAKAADAPNLSDAKKDALEKAAKDTADTADMYRNFKTATVPVEDFHRRIMDAAHITVADAIANGHLPEDFYAAPSATDQA